MIRRSRLIQWASGWWALPPPSITDLLGADPTIGVDTALNIALEAINEKIATHEAPLPSCEVIEHIRDTLALAVNGWRCRGGSPYMKSKPIPKNWPR